MWIRFVHGGENPLTIEEVLTNVSEFVTYLGVFNLVWLPVKPFG